jgi:peptidyl-dipeptidase Dcp
MTTRGNPLLELWDTPFELPPFQDIQSSHFVGAFEQAILEHRTEVEAIADSHESPDFKNTLIALESSGQLLDRTSSLF